MPRLNVDFYAAKTLDGKALDLKATLHTIDKRIARDRLVNRNQEYDDYLEITRAANGQIFGLAARIRKTGIPKRFNLKTLQRKSLDISIEEGLEEVAHFIYDSGLMTLALQRHKLFRSGAWQKLVSQLAETPFELEPRLRKDKWERFKRMDRIASLELALIRPDEHPALADVQPSLGSMFEHASQDGNAFRIDLKFSMAGSRTSSLTPKWVNGIVGYFRKHDENLGKFTVTGSPDDGRAEAIDFLRDRLVFSGEVEYSSRSLDGKECWQFIREALSKHQDDLKSLL